MPTLHIQMPNDVMQQLAAIAERSSQAVEAAQRSLDFTKSLVAETGPIYATLSEELKTQREVLDDIRKRLHELGNAINGKLGAYEAEKFIRQVIDEVLKQHKVI